MRGCIKVLLAAAAGVFLWCFATPRLQIAEGKLRSLALRLRA